MIKFLLEHSVAHGSKGIKEYVFMRVLLLMLKRFRTIRNFGDYLLCRIRSYLGKLYTMSNALSFISFLVDT